MFRKSMATLPALGYFSLLCSLLFPKTVAADQPSYDANSESSRDKTIGVSIFAGIVLLMMIAFAYKYCKCGTEHTPAERQRLFSGEAQQKDGDNEKDNKTAGTSTDGSNPGYMLYPDLNKENQNSAESRI